VKVIKTKGLKKTISSSFFTFGEFARVYEFTCRRSRRTAALINKVFIQETIQKPSGIYYAIPVNHLQALLNRQTATPETLFTPEVITRKPSERPIWTHQEAMEPKGRSGEEILEKTRN
jgi:hypothetical protein